MPDMIAMVGQTGKESQEEYHLTCSFPVLTPFAACAFKRNGGINREALASGAKHHRVPGEEVVLIASIIFSVGVSLLCVWIGC
jgi:hypothetical protein